MRPALSGLWDDRVGQERPQPRVTSVSALAIWLLLGQAADRLALIVAVSLAAVFSRRLTAFCTFADAGCGSRAT